MAGLIFTTVALLRIAELAWANHNTRALLARGATEVGRRHYPLFFMLHGAWLGALLWRVPLDAVPEPTLLIIFVGLQFARLWVILSLGSRWTTRIITLPGVPLVRKGPYRFLRHPNYLVVACEIAVLPLAFGEWEVAAIFSTANVGLLLWRIRVEEQALRETQRSWNEECNAT